jgi:hypothetical protein
MDPVCHRCGAALNSSEELFCPHCGAPQLRFEPSDEPVSSFASAPQTTHGRSLDTISWKAAIVSALFVAIPVGLLSSILDFGSIWVIGGGIATVSLYRRRAGAPATHRMGWRIGGLLGVLSAFMSTATYSIKLLIQRYMLHSGELDQQVHSVARQFVDQANRSDPQTAAAMAQLSRFWLSPEGTATIVLSAAAISALSMVLFGAAGGAIGARIASLGPRAQRSS